MEKQKEAFQEGYYPAPPLYVAVEVKPIHLEQATPPAYEEDQRRQFRKARLQSAACRLFCLSVWLIYMYFWMSYRSMFTPETPLKQPPETTLKHPPNES